ncbi:DNA-damage-inducible protein J, putative [Thermodesulfovibrio yellowstonii DSM 11347]|uniref:DNA-damage-inducible protein J, putative n=2 Tax=Thermodesulfovibrio yellowstonii TaxID=28262 RepID=B5YIH4_THEYD|nr:DNA-damage-inducible protein J, putative [Thermodesulfovibrio yellowstonii DSM 11347]
MIDKDLQEKAKKVFKKYNLSLNEGINMLLRQIVKEKKLPLEAGKELKKAIEESRKGKVVAFKNTEELLKEIRK